MPMNDYIAEHASAVTPSNVADQYGSALYVSGPGAVALETEGGETLTFGGLLGGGIARIRFRKILAAGTTALNLVRLSPNPIYPSVDVAPAVSGLTPVGSVLTVSTGNWVGAGPFTYTYKWFKNGVQIAGQVASTYTTVGGDLGTAITAEVTATNSAGRSTSARSSNSITVT